VKRRKFLKQLAATPILTVPLWTRQPSFAASRPDKVSDARAAQSVIRVGSDRQLFIDDALISRMKGAELMLHSPTAREVALLMERPWEGSVSWASVVMKDGDKYRMWYRADPERKDLAKDAVRTYTAYAESSDGISWERPDLGLIDYQGSKKNNLVWAGPGGNMSLFKDQKPGIPASELYKATVRARFAYGLVSPDGLRWQLVKEEPILTQGLFDSHNIVFQDPWTYQYLYYGRGFVPTPPGRTSDLKEGIRRIRRSTSDDFRTWSPLEFIDMGKEPLDHLYTNAAVPYLRARGIYFMFPKRFVPERTFDSKWPLKGLSDIVFASSRDGLHWDRTFLEAFVRPGLDPRNWHERAIAMGQGIVQTGPNELSMYYFENLKTDSNRIRRCTIRPDGFVSINARYAGGEVITRPLVFAGKSLRINYATSAAGSIRVEVQDEAERPLTGFDDKASDEIFGDELERQVGWTSAAELGNQQGKPVRLRFVLKDADLFSFRFGAQ
jgi:hypothetical protein